MAIQKFLKVAKQLAALPAGERKAAIDVAKELGSGEPAPKRTYKKCAKTVAPGVKVIKGKRGPGRPKKEKPEEPAAAAAE